MLFITNRKIKFNEIQIFITHFDRSYFSENFGILNLIFRLEVDLLWILQVLMIFWNFRNRFKRRRFSWCQRCIMLTLAYRFRKPRSNLNHLIQIGRPKIDRAGGGAVPHRMRSTTAAVFGQRCWRRLRWSPGLGNGGSGFGMTWRSSSPPRLLLSLLRSTAARAPPKLGNGGGGGLVSELEIELDLAARVRAFGCGVWHGVGAI